MIALYARLVNDPSGFAYRVTELRQTASIIAPSDVTVEVRLASHILGNCWYQVPTEAVLLGPLEALAAQARK